MAKPNFVAASKSLADLFEGMMSPDTINMISSYVIDDSRRGHYLILGLVPEQLSLYDVLGCESSRGLKGNRDIEMHFDMPALDALIFKEFEKNKKENRNSMCCVYFKQKVPPYSPLFFLELCVPLEDKALVMLNKRSDYIYVGKYHSKPEDITEYLSAIKPFQEYARFLGYQAVANMRIHSKSIFMNIVRRQT